MFSDGYYYDAPEEIFAEQSECMWENRREGFDFPPLEKDQDFSNQNVGVEVLFRSGELLFTSLQPNDEKQRKDSSALIEKVERRLTWARKKVGDSGDTKPFNRKHVRNSMRLLMNQNQMTSIEREMLWALAMKEMRNLRRKYLKC